MPSAQSKSLQRFQGVVWGDQVKDSALYFDGHTFVVDVQGRDAGVRAFQVRALNTQNAPLEVFGVDKDGTVTFPSITLTGNLTFSSTAQRITGDMTNATHANRLAFQNSVGNGATIVSLFPNGTSAQSQVNVYNSSDPDNAGIIRVQVLGTSGTIGSSTTGTGSLPTTLSFAGFTGGYTFDGKLSGYSVPEVRAYNSANISINTGATTALTFDSERYDTDAIHDTATNTGRLTCKTAGKYSITGHVRFAANATGFRIAFIRLNGATLIAGQAGPVHASNPTDLTVSADYDLAVNDYVELAVFQDSGGSLNVTALGNLSPEFSMKRVG